ncbi:MAG TPA: adenylosuccinate lyase [Bacteroidales bacterium]|nr:adenylosuccinate lyase [Bacteroidales bacterium]
MDLNKLTAISPIDGRYRDRVKNLAGYFSEYGLIKYRLKSEVEYFIALSNIPLPQLKGFKTDNCILLRSLYQNFNISDATRVKDIEKVTNHDVKAVEYYLKEKFHELKLGEWTEFIHFGLTSQDINNTAIPLSVKECSEQVFVPLLLKLISELNKLAEEWSGIPMLARTHGQPASPTRLGKEIEVFARRLEIQAEGFKSVPWSAKFGGASGNMNAHYIAYPEIDWDNFADRFVNEDLGLQRSKPTTQIDHYDNFAALLDASRRINTILIDFCRDIWLYISFEYFKQRISKNEVGSSAMPHKVNPIDFENAEGNLGIANSVLGHLSEKLPVSRLQRDLTDSTVLRNTGVPFAHTHIAILSILKGLGKLIVNRDKIEYDLDNNWAVVAEAIQTILRREGYPRPYETLKELTRTNSRITRESLNDFIENLNVKDSVKEELKAITPFNYTGK